MRRLARVDWLLIAGLTPVAIVALGLHVSEVIATSLAHTPLYASAPEPDGWPHVSGFYIGFGDATAGLQVGDRLIRIGDRDMRRRGHAAVDAALYAEASSDLKVSIEYERGGERRVATASLVPLDLAWRRIPMLLATASIAFVILLRATSPSQGRRFFYTFVPFAILVSSFAGAPAAQAVAWKYTHLALGALVPPLMLRFLQYFPDEDPPGPVGRSWPWLLTPAYALVRGSYHLGGPVPPALVPQSIALLDAIWVLCALGLLTHAYRTTDAGGRRQIRWVLLGAYLGLMPLAIALALGALGVPSDLQRSFFGVSLIATVCCPLGFGIAIVRAQLWDIDRLIGTAASYTVIGVALLAGALVLVPAASDRLGLDGTAGRLIVATLLAVVAIPAHLRLRPWIEHTFFPERVARLQGLGALVGELPRERGVDELFEHVGERLDDLLTPDACVVYASSVDAFTPVFVRGRAVPIAFASAGWLASMLAGAGRPVSVGSLPTGAAGAGDAFDRAALETLGAALLVPIVYTGSLLAFLCLGRKRSGDLYTDIECALLGAISGALAIELARIGEAERAERVVERFERLRSYVPQAVAARVERGESVAPHEREVSVLFVDIRGYTGFAEERRAEDVFSAVNRYTEEVSATVTAHGGHVVEFNGDGMMAVFGAPEPLEAKEARAVRAARELVERVPRLSLAGEKGLEVGVGVATGPAFVGSIRAVDRLIWSAIGNTTNLAARLQTLTRPLDAAVVIDRVTHSRCGEVGRPFRARAGVRIPGRRRREDLFLLTAHQSA